MRIQHIACCATQYVQYGTVQQSTISIIFYDTVLYYSTVATVAAMFLKYYIIQYHKILCKICKKSVLENEIIRVTWVNDIPCFECILWALDLSNEEIS